MSTICPTCRQTTTLDLRALRAEAHAAGDRLQAALCTIALGETVRGLDALAMAEQDGYQLRASQDALDTDRPVSLDEARQVAREDASLVYLVGGPSADQAIALCLAAVLA